MKRLSILFYLLLVSLSATGQEQRGLSPRPVAGLPPSPQPGVGVVPFVGQRDTRGESPFTPFDLNFPGGTPAQLQAHIEQATSKALNVIIPPEFADSQLPPLKMNNVTVPQLFDALSAACRKVGPAVVGYFNSPPGAPPTPRYEERESSMGFRMTPGLAPTETTVWHFFRITPPVVKEPTEPPICRFFNLEEPLTAYKIEDITTALHTSYKMLGDTNPPTMTFHKDTKLLIAVGDPGKLKLIEAMLTELTGTKPGFNSVRPQFQKTPPAKHPPKGADNPEP